MLRHTKDESKSKHADVNPQYSERAMRMMKDMGYKENAGLGRFEQGRVEPIETSQQKGRRGLGLRLDELDIAALKWDKSLESPLDIPERIEWYQDSKEEEEEELVSMDLETLWSWIKVGPKKLSIADETHFCDEDILSNILQSKTIFDKLGSLDMIKARSRANPFESIKHNIFQNRAAVKMANIDALFDFMFTYPVDHTEQSPLKNGILYFADVCAGPGGFSEYILFRRGWTAKGFGFTLKNDNDFRLHEFYAGSPETFDTYYGINNDGNIFDPENCISLKEYVLKQTHDGVHVLMADGGFSVEGQENIQEILSKQLYLCQCLVALSLLRVGGNFVVKLFDIFTPFSVSLIYLISKCFVKICICKPNTSRPANSERYLVCKSKKRFTDVIEKHLFKVNEYFWENKDSDVLELVPLDILKEKSEFAKYIRDSNNRFGRLQVEALLKIAAFTKDINLLDDRQVEVKKKCLMLWKLEDKVRRITPKISNQNYLTDLLLNWAPSKDSRIFMDVPPKILDKENLKKVILSIYDWYTVPLESEKNSLKHLRTFFMSKGGRNVLYYNHSSRTWIQVSDLHLEITPRTLIYAEIVKEFIEEGKKQRSISALHIIDAICLGGTDVRKLHLTERIKMCSKFARALNKPLKTIVEDNNHRMTVPIRCKRIYPLKDFARFVESLKQFTMKNGETRLGIVLPNECNDIEDRYFIPEGLLFLNGTNEAFMKCLSKSAQTFYFFDKRSRQSHQPTSETVALSTASFKNTFINRFNWKWDETQSNLKTNSNAFPQNESLLFKHDIEQLLLV